MTHCQTDLSAASLERWNASLLLIPEKLFAKEWNFCHVTSSPHYAQSNGLAENAVKREKQLLEKCKTYSSDVLLGLLNLCNIPRKNTTGSQAQQLLSRWTLMTIPMSQNLLVPKPLTQSKCLQNWEITASNRRFTVTSMKKISNLWNPIKWHACSHRRNSRNLLSWNFE